MEKPIRILQVFGRLDRGGAETMLLNLYRCMDREQIQFDFVIHTDEECDYTKEVEMLGGRIYSMKPFRAATAFVYRKQWKNFFQEHKEYKVVHGHMRSTAALYFAEAKKAGLVTIAHSHNTSSGSGLSAVVKNVLQYPLRYEADYLFACSRSAGEWLYGKKACESTRFRLLLNGIEPEEFRFDGKLRQKIRKKMQVSENTMVFLHIGRMEEQKNHKFLLRIMKELIKLEEEDGREAVLWLCGMGPLEKELRRQAEKENISDRVCFLGVREDIPALLQAADAFLFPSLFEGLPVTVVEAQAAGLPIVMSDTITKEVCLSDLTESCSLEEDVSVWAKKAFYAARKKEGDRTKYAEIIAQKGYDVKQNAEKLSAFYQSLYEDRE